MAGPPAPWELCLLQPLALACASSLEPRAGKGFPEPHPCPWPAWPAGPQAWAGGGVPEAGVATLPLGSGDGERRGKVEALQEPLGGVMGDPGLRSALAPLV